MQARNDTEVAITLHLSENDDHWIYDLVFKASGRGKQLINVTKEMVTKNGIEILSRPNDKDQIDSVQLTQTYLEQILANQDFRVVANFFTSITYLHIVPQLLKFAKEIGINKIEDDPFGQGFLDRLANTQNRTRDAWLKRYNPVYQLRYPNLKN